MSHKKIIWVLLFSPFLTFAQYKLEYGVKLGASNYLGDMGGKQLPRRDFVWDLKFKATRPDGALYFRKRFRKEWAYRGAFSWVRISGADSLSTNPGRRGRNLSFRNDLYELSADLQYIFYRPNDVARWGRYRIDFQSYIFAGVAGAYSNPKAFYNGDWIALRPLNTEALEKQYSKYILAIPMGVGFSYTVGRKHRIGAELNYRHTFNDYLDDVSTYYPAKGTLKDPLAIALSNRNGEIPVDLKSDLPDPANYGPNLSKPSELQKRGDPTHSDVYIGLTVNYSYVIKGKRSTFYRSKYNFITGVRKKFKKKRVKAKF